MEKLAIQGGSPVRTQKIFYGRQWVDEGDVKAVESVLVSDYLTCGPKVQEMERTLENIQELSMQLRYLTELLHYIVHV